LSETPEPVSEQAPVVVEQPTEQKLQVPAGEAANNVTFGVAVAISFVASAITAACMLVAYDHFLAKKIISVDVKGFVQEQQDLYLAGKISDEQLKQNYAALKAAVEKIPRNRVVIMGDAILGGAEKLELPSANTTNK